MQKTFDSLKDNDIEIIVIAYLLKHPNLMILISKIWIILFANIENMKIFNVLEDFIDHKNSLLIQ